MRVSRRGGVKLFTYLSGAVSLSIINAETIEEERSLEVLELGLMPLFPELSKPPEDILPFLHAPKDFNSALRVPDSR